MRDTMSNWQKELAEGLASVSELLQFVGLPKEHGSVQACQVFKTKVPKRFAALMEKGNPEDPLLLQVLPKAEELHAYPYYVEDPLQEKEAIKADGLLHKYHGRVLLTLTGTCAINCRYCFRRHFPYSNNNPQKNKWHDALEYIANDTSIMEVILSGGDPLIVNDNSLFYFLRNLEKITHVKIIRFHTRLPVVLPSRIDDMFLARLAELNLKKIFIFHSNHPNEINHEVARACSDLKKIGVSLFNQSVLLQGVNDCAFVLRDLSLRLFECDVIPYYLHLLDKVAGAMHFDTPKGDAQKIHDKLQSLLPGYLVPKLVQEIPNHKNKTLVNKS